MRPVPYHDDYRCWAKGASTAMTLLVAAIVLISFGSVFILGMLSCNGLISGA